MSHAGYFKLLKLYADIWARRHCRVVLAGEQVLDGARHRPRVYLITHPVTWDLPMLAHMGANNFYVVADKGPFAHPLVRWLFLNSGFIKLEGDNSEEVVQRSVELVAAHRPLIMSLYGYGVDFGEKVRPRTGGIRVAHAAKADIYPIHLWIEDGKRIMKSFRGLQGKAYPFSVFHDTLYFATFLEPLRHDEWARDAMTYDEYTRLAYRLESLFERTEADIRAGLAEGRFANLPRRGGLERPVIY